MRHSSLTYLEIIMNSYLDCTSISTVLNSGTHSCLMNSKPKKNPEDIRYGPTKVKTTMADNESFVC